MLSNRSIYKKLTSSVLLLGVCFLFQNCSEKSIDEGSEGGFVLGSFADIAGTPCERFAFGLDSLGDNTFEIDFDQGGAAVDVTRVKCLDHSGGKAVELTFLSDAFNVDVAKILKNPSAKLDVTVIVPSGVTIGSKSTLLPALQTGTLISGSHFHLINNGTVQGAGGKGGHGGACLTPSLSGEKGGVAVDVTVSSTINTANGSIMGGGGGGGGGGDACQLKNGQVACTGGGGGGGGAGSDPGQGGSFTRPQGDCDQFNGNFPGENGLADFGGSSMGDFGGRGGDPGEPGEAGQSHSGMSTAFGQPGGAAGEAIVKNKNTVEVIGENRVKGPILSGAAPARNPLPL